jgi:hypothetical protein
VQLLERSGTVDTPIGASDLALMSSMGGIPATGFQYNAAAAADIDGSAVASQCGDQLVLRVQVLPGTKDVAPWPILDIP